MFIFKKSIIAQSIVTGTGVSVTYLGSFGSGSNQINYDFTGLIIPRSGLLVIVHAAKSSTARRYTGSNVGGVIATTAVDSSGVDKLIQLAIAYQTIDPGTYTIRSEYNNSVSSAGGAAYLLENYSSPIPVSTEWIYETSTTAISNTIDLPAQGATIIGSSNSTIPYIFPLTWTAATGNMSISPNGEGYFASANIVSPSLVSGHVETFTFGESDRRLLCSASWT